MTPTEIIGALTGLLCVYLTMRASVWCWPVGIVSSLAYTKLFLEIHLYADALLQVFFIASSVLGWWAWRGGSQTQSTLRVTLLRARDRVWMTLVTALAIGLTGWLFASYSDAHVPYWDALASGLSVTAQLLLTRKKLENWVLWIVVDVLSIGIYIYKEVYLTAGLYVLFLAIATRGLLEWRRLYRAEESVR